ncbi:alpha-L-fucosidase [Runella slithyformis]|uniref:alpha-L-fucosidase n=1 Tax=Runella slithyformis (strain ATCC 29530 / DSM 19594 / LMG 11500 / NCIMB 11436 / LSU 4) TaxID=761193 RepID=A0A7U3ZKR8_RUNSL|nr:alpha-L-fucosidase [Runella slithyformis]AEI49020.1 Alpha-L-fucosidase [Runella slithyformis DSM 19594]
MKNGLLFLLIVWGLAVNVKAQVHDFPKPTPSQMAWHEAELGAVFHYDLHVFDGKKYNQAYNRITPIEDITIFNPTQLNTDQWIKAVKAMGGKFAILTATHETGFALYQSDVNPYCMKSLKFQEGKGDLVRDFVNSCRKYGIAPGIYLGIRWNSFLGVHDFRIDGESPLVKNRQMAYKKMCEGMVKELCTRYGDLFMIWFDGGADDPTKYGADVLPIVEKYQPKCLFYHNAQRADFRWGGSESGTVPYPCWATFPFPFSHAAQKEIVFKDDFKLLKEGDKDGKYWMPAMSDAPLRGYNGRHEWFWEPDDDAHIFPLKNLVDMYERSVGHNSTLIIGLTPDDRGLLPEADVQRLTEWGREIKSRFSNPLKTAHGEGTVFELTLDKKQAVNYIVLQEDITQGERVRGFKIEVERDKKWKTIAEGTTIGYKHIRPVDPIEGVKFRLTITQSSALPILKNVSVFNVMTNR